jgi:NADH-ubiquinone oxidoreductase chain 5
MAAPTPVSALVHSSTLVTAGIFILIRFFPSLKSIPALEHILLFAAAVTACVAGLAAIAECDIKKVIALSTLSQLGTISYSLAISIPHLAFFHLITHALFKALLFIAAGALIHFHNHNQDLRAMGILNNSMPLISMILTTSRLALCGAPFIAGFYSKDLIIEAQINNPANYLLIMVFLLATGLTSAYRVRLMLNVV